MVPLGNTLHNFDVWSPQAVTNFISGSDQEISKIALSCSEPRK